MCNHQRRKVLDTSRTDGGAVITRRCQCLVCEERFTTKEYPVLPETALRLAVVSEALKSRGDRRSPKNTPTGGGWTS